MHNYDHNPMRCILLIIPTLQMKKLRPKFSGPKAADPELEGESCLKISLYGETKSLVFFPKQ